MAQTSYFLKKLTLNLRTLRILEHCLDVTLGPFGTCGISCDTKQNLILITSGSSLILSLKENRNIILTLLAQCSLKTKNITGKGSTTAILLSCEIIKSSLKFLASGCNQNLLHSGLKKSQYFLAKKTWTFSSQLRSNLQIKNALKTSLGSKLRPEFIAMLCSAVDILKKNGLIAVEESLLPVDEFKTTQGIEINKGFASPYFTDGQKNAEIIFTNPYVFVTTAEITHIDQISTLVTYANENSRPLICVASNISKSVLTALILHNIKKDAKTVAIKYTGIKYLQNNLLEDLSILTNCTIVSGLKEPATLVSKLGCAEKVIIQKNRSLFFISKFSKAIAKHKVNELSQNLLISENHSEKDILKSRISRLSGNIIKIKVSSTSKYQFKELCEIIKSSVKSLSCSLEEGIVPGGGAFYSLLEEELAHWASFNLAGEEIFSSYILRLSLLKPAKSLQQKVFHINKNFLLQKLSQLGYPYAYNCIEQKLVHTFKNGLVDSAKSSRATLWNALSTALAVIISI